MANLCKELLRVPNGHLCMRLGSMVIEETHLLSLQRPSTELSEERTSVHHTELTSSANLGATPWRSPGKRLLARGKLLGDHFRGIGKRPKITSFCF